MGDQLAAGRVDAVVTSIPFTDAIAARGFRIHDDVVVDAVRDASGGTVETAMTSVWTASRAFGREHADTVSAWRKSLSAAIEFLDGNPAEARADDAGLAEDPRRESLTPAPLPDWDVAITPQELAPYITISKAVGLDAQRPRCERACVARVVNLIPVRGRHRSAFGFRPPTGHDRSCRTSRSRCARARSSRIVGRSGAGKTTLLRVLGGLLEASNWHSGFRRQTSCGGRQPARSWCSRTTVTRCCRGARLPATPASAWKAA